MQPGQQLEHSWHAAVPILQKEFNQLSLRDKSNSMCTLHHSAYTMHTSYTVAEARHP